MPKCGYNKKDLPSGFDTSMYENHMKSLVTSQFLAHTAEDFPLGEKSTRLLRICHELLPLNMGDVLNLALVYRLAVRLSRGQVWTNCEFSPSMFSQSCPPTIDRKRRPPEPDERPLRESMRKKMGTVLLYQLVACAQLCGYFSSRSFLSSLCPARRLLTRALHFNV